MTPKEYQAMNDIDLFGVYRGLQATICIPGTRKIDWERDRVRAAKRLQLLPEVNRRGRSLLKANGWPEQDNAQYVNIHTGTIESLFQILNPSGKVFIILEHWLPLEQVHDPNAYKPINTQLSLL